MKNGEQGIEIKGFEFVRISLSEVQSVSSLFHVVRREGISKSFIKLDEERVKEEFSNLNFSDCIYMCVYEYLSLFG